MAKNENQNETEFNENEKTHKIQSLREMINSAEKTIQSAKAMLLQLEGKKKTGRRRKNYEENDGSVIEGTFDGQLMIGVDGKQYPVPANYASKSKLVEGDMLKLTITPDGSFIYKQIGPVERKNALGIVSQDENGNYYIIAEGKPYKVLLASVTYFKAEPGDEVAIVLPRSIETSWASIENIIQKGKEKRSVMTEMKSADAEATEEEEKKPDDAEPKVSSDSADSKESNLEKQKMIMDEWTKDIEDIEKELKEENGKKTATNL
jgi:hypothetical protein